MSNIEKYNIAVQEHNVAIAELDLKKAAKEFQAATDWLARQQRKLIDMRLVYKTQSEME